MPDEESLKRWKELFLRSKEKGSKNIQVQGQEAPTDEEGFLRLTIIDEARGIKEFVVTSVLTDVINRKRNRAEYFTTLPDDGSKIGVSLQWRKREHVWENVTDEHIERLHHMMKEFEKQQQQQQQQQGVS